MDNYVMLGHNHLFGDFAEIIHANGGILKKVIQNIPEPVHDRRLSLGERIDRIASPSENVNRINQCLPIEVEKYEAFTPRIGDHHFIGFTGPSIEGFRREILRLHAITFSPLIHPTAIISPSASILSGAVIHAGAIIASGVRIGEHASINKGAIIGHDTSVGPFAVIQPGVKIAGHVSIGKAAYVGIGAVVIEDCIVGDGAKIAAGAVVIDDVRGSTLVAGVPAIFKKNLDASHDAPSA